MKSNLSVLGILLPILAVACAPVGDPSDNVKSDLGAQASAPTPTAYNCVSFGELGGSTKVDLQGARVCEGGGPPTDPGFCSSSLANVYPIVTVRDGSINQAGTTIAFKEIYAEKQGKVVYVKIFAPTVSDPVFGAERVHHADIISDTSGPPMFAASATAPLVEGEGACYEL